MGATLPTGQELRRERLARRLQQLAAAAPGSIQAHARLLHRDDQDRPLRAARHHAEWCYYLEAPWLHNDNRYRWLCIVAPPGYAKSTWGTKVYGAWRIGTTGGSVRLGVISNTATQAYGFAQDIRGVVGGHWFHRTYGVQQHPELPWTQDQFWTTGSVDRANPTVLAAGIGGPITGKRFDEILLDDPTTWEQARSPVIMASQRSWLKNTLIKRLPVSKRPPDGDGRVVVPLTRWGTGDLVPTLQELGFRVVRMPALGYWDRARDPETGELTYGEEALWPEAESQATLQHERENDPLVFDLVMQGDAKAGAGGDVFDPANFQRGHLPPPGEYSHVIMYVDTAGGKQAQKGDYFAMMTAGTHQAGLRDWIVDGFRERLTAPDQLVAVQQRAELVRQMCGRLDGIIIEQKNEGIALYQNLAGTSRLPLIDADKDWAKGDKEWRAIPLATGYKVRRIWHPEGAKWVRSYEAELEAFPHGPNDDQVDAAAGAYAHTGTTGPRLRILR